MKNLQRFNFLVGEIGGLYHEAALRLGLSDSGMAVLYHVCVNHGSCALSDIYKLSGTCKQTINSAVRKLEKEDLIYLEMVNQKSKRVCLTEKGKKIMPHTVEHLIQIENDILKSWTEEERMIYLHLTQRYLDAMQKQIVTLGEKS